MFTSRDLLGELARYPTKADGLQTKAHEFMIPLSRMIYCSPKDSLYQCLLVMSELKVTFIVLYRVLFCVREKRGTPSSGQTGVHLAVRQKGVHLVVDKQGYT